MCTRLLVISTLLWPAAGVCEPLLPDPPRKIGRRPGQAPVTQATFVRLAAQLGPAVVHLTVTPRPGDEEPRRAGKEQGTGFVVHRDGYLLTNNHVVQRASEIRARLHDERELSATIVGRDERTDIALLKLDGAAGLSAAPLGDSDALQIGEWVVAIGSPFGLDHTVTAGIVSAKGRREVHPGGAPGFFDFIQTDASINPGNSGGPLINTRGEVIGINTAVNIAGNGIGFAIPINLARVIARKLHQRGRVVRSWLGVYPQPISENLRRAFCLGNRQGALLSEVVSGSPAHEAGLLPGDVIVEFDGKPVQRADDLVWLASITDPRKTEVRVMREGQQRTLSVILAEAGGEEAPPPPTPVPAPTALGMTALELTPAMARQINYPDGTGVVVMQVEASSPAMEAGIERGDVILQINGQEVRSLVEYARRMHAVPQGEVLRLLVRREERKSWRNVWVAFTKR